MSKGPHWAKDEIDKLSMLARHHTLLELTHLINRSEKSIRARLLIMGMSAKPSPNGRKFVDGLDLKSRVHELCDQGKRPAEIARLLNASVDYVSYCARTYLGTGAGLGTVVRDPQRERKHLLAIADASNAKGFPYGVSSPRISTTKSNPVDRPPIGLLSQFSASAKQRIIET